MYVKINQKLNTQDTSETLKLYTKLECVEYTMKNGKKHISINQLSLEYIKYIMKYKQINKFDYL